MTDFALIIPSRNAEPYLDRLIPAIRSQSLQPAEWLVVDSSSSDRTVSRLRESGARVEVIPAEMFNHGGTRHWACQKVSADYLMFLTQDAIPEDRDSFSRLIGELNSAEEIGVAYGRQLPHNDAGLLGAQARCFNYPCRSRTKRISDADELGIKTCFSSDSFAAYKRSALERVGGFPTDVIGSEDAYVAARMLLQGLAVRYAASARVRHSHDYYLSEEFRRYFDIGVFYGRERWIGETFGGASGEGLRYLRAELSALRSAGALWRVPEVLLRTLLKFTGYRLGRAEAFLPRCFKRRISMFSTYWS